MVVMGDLVPHVGDPWIRIITFKQQNLFQSDPTKIVLSLDSCSYPLRGLLLTRHVFIRAGTSSSASRQ